MLKMPRDAFWGVECEEMCKFTGESMQCRNQTPKLHTVLTSLHYQIEGTLVSGIKFKV